MVVIDRKPRNSVLVIFAGLSSIYGHMGSDKDSYCTLVGREWPTATVQNLWVGKDDYVILESAWKPEPQEMELQRKSRAFADFITLEDRA